MFHPWLNSTVSYARRGPRKAVWHRSLRSVISTRPPWFGPTCLPSYPDPNPDPICAADRSFMHKLLSIAILSLSGAICGCGTMASINDSTGNMPPRPFGGIAHDLDALAAGNPLGAIDLPGSLVADVVTLPDVLVENAHAKRASQPLPRE